MSKRLYPHNKLRYWYTYDIDEICFHFKNTGLHTQTVRKWIKNGLQAIDGKRPFLIYGYDLIIYLKAHNQRHKCNVEFDQLYCMKCQDARPALQRQLRLIKKARFFQAKAICRTCKTTMLKNYKLADYAQLKRIFKLVDVLEFI